MNLATSESDLQNGFKLANYLVSGITIISNPYKLLTTSLHMLTKYDKGNNAKFNDNTQTLLSIPLIRHRNVIVSFVAQWEEQLKTKALSFDSFTDSQKELFNTLKSCLYEEQNNIEQGYRTPLILLDYVNVKCTEGNLKKDYVQAFSELSKNENSRFAATFMKKVASWQG